MNYELKVHELHGGKWTWTWTKFIFKKNFHSPACRNYDNRDRNTFLCCFSRFMSLLLGPTTESALTSIRGSLSKLWIMINVWISLLVTLSYSSCNFRSVAQVSPILDDGGIDGFQLQLRIGSEFVLQDISKPCTGLFIRSDTWVGLTWILLFHCQPSSAWANGNLAEVVGRAAR